MRWALACVMAVAGCASSGSYRTADVLDAGEMNMFAAPQVHGAGPTDGTRAPSAELALGARRGVAPRTEVGVTATMVPLGRVVTTLGLELGAKRHLWRSNGGRVDIAVAATVGYRYQSTSDASWEAALGAVPVIVGVNFGDDQLAISPMVGWQRWYGTSGSVDIPHVGYSLGYRWQINETWGLLPEVAWSYTPTALNSLDGGTLVHAGLAVLYRR